MGTERPSKGVLIFQCDACYDTHEFSKAEGDDVGNYQECWRVLHDDGWRMKNGDHLCTDCAKIAKSEETNPFKRR